MTTTEPTPAQRAAYCRKAVAIWLREFADRVDSGEVDAFDLKWSNNADMFRPSGQILADASFVKAKLPGEAEKVASPRLSEIRAKIPVEDLSENLRDLKPCNDPNCPNCRVKA